jgi:hypothetical protein
MDIEQFYDADPRRRPSAEVELGTDWRDSFGVRYELNWIVETGELYTMREPVPYEWEDPLGGYHVRGDTEGMTAAVIATIPTLQGVEDLLRGWEQAIERPNSVAWLAERLRESGLATASS